ncbi:MAG: glycosyltransferase [Thermoleophilia bacterium]
MVSAGTTRVVRFLRHLPARGWDPTVLAVSADSMGSPVSDTRVVRAPVFTPRVLLRGGRRSTRINRWACVPDPYVTWVGPAIARGVKLAGKHDFDAIFSSSPRPSVHLVAAALAGFTGLPWLADYRDPWSTYQFRKHPTRAHQSAHRFLEARVLREASWVTGVNQPIVDDIVDRHPWLAECASVLPNGYDVDEDVETVSLGPGFWIVHTGRLYGREAQVNSFLTALAVLPDDVKVLFVGVDETRVMPDAHRLGVADRVRVEPFVSHGRALGYQRAADGLLLVNGRRPESLSSKVFEYLDAGPPVFAISPAGSAARALFEEVGGGVCVLPDSDMAMPLRGFVESVRLGEAPRASRQMLSRYDVTRLTDELAELLERIADGAPWWARRNINERPAGEVSQ